MYPRETFIMIVDYVKSEKGKSMEDKCALFNMRPTVYYKLCRKYDIDGKMGTKKPKKALSEKEVKKIITKNKKTDFFKKKTLDEEETLDEKEASNREEHTSDEDGSE